MKRTILIMAALAVSVAMLIPASGTAAIGEPNPWLARRILNMSHQGGEIEAPSNTMFAYKTSLPKGSEMLELDVHATADREIVALHDTSVNRTTNGTGRVDALTLAQLRTLDAAHWFVPGIGTVSGRPAAEYIYRGIATGQKAPPAGYSAADFTIPTLREVLTQFPNTPINIEIKRTVPDTTPYETILADLLREFGRDDDVIVVAFSDASVEIFKAYAPEIHTATATVESAVFYVTAAHEPSVMGRDATLPADLPGAPNPRYVAMQVPIEFEGIRVVTRDFVEDAHANGTAVHVWTINLRSEMEYLECIGVDGIMTDVPTLLEEVLTDSIVNCAGE